MRKYKVLLVDDHRILLEGVRSLIQDSFIICEVASNGVQALKLIKSTDFDALITDYEMPDINGLELVKAAKAAQPEMKVIVLSMHDDPAIVKELLRSGTLGYVLKKDTHKSLTEALTKVMEGKRFLSDEITEMLISSSAEEEKSVLTEREVEILRLVAKEYNSRQIADILSISERTVETHRKNILKKTGASNLVGLIKYAYTNNLT
ncbi:MAG: response regulator transcription factor [Bacteroidetes bacterium]|nr:response regulator transcription factor [Bacteroidota bacterium]